MRNGVVLSQTSASRISAAAEIRKAVDPRASNFEALRAAAADLDKSSASCNFSEIASAFAAYAELMRCCAMLVQWRSAVVNAEPESARFLLGAAERCKIFHREYGRANIPSALVAISERIKSISATDQVAEVCKELAATPLPVPYFAAIQRPDWAGKLIGQEEPKAPEQLSVAFVRFEINGTLADETHFLPPQVAHDLELEVRVSRWPASATSLHLRPVSIEAADSYDFPRFEFDKPPGDPPFVLKKRGRALLNVPQSLLARPFEFKYTAEFGPLESEQPLAVVGQRTLRIESIDVRKSPLTGYPGMDLKILELRNQIRAHNLLVEADFNAMLTLLIALANVASQAVQDNMYDGVWSEAEFQEDLKRDLRRRPEIGADLEEHPHGAGGINDLSFRGIRLELKSKSDKRMTLTDCDQFVDQTVSYAVGAGKRWGLLCVLDCSPKTVPAFPAEDGIGFTVRHADHGGVVIAVVLIQGNLALPSNLSRSGRPSTTRSGG